VLPSGETGCSDCWDECDWGKDEVEPDVSWGDLPGLAKYFTITWITDMEPEGNA